jgi:cytochrome P450
VFFIQRQVTEDIELEGYKIPAGTSIALDIYNLHHNPSVWGEDRNEFKPERFSPDKVKDMDPFAFLPFSAGQRFYTLL